MRKSMIILALILSTLPLSGYSPYSPAHPLYINSPINPASPLYIGRSLHRPNHESRVLKCIAVEASDPAWRNRTDEIPAYCKAKDKITQRQD